MNLFQIQTPLQLNKWMIMKCNISWSSSTGSRMIIFWMLNFICSRLYCWFPLLQNFKQSLLCCFITMEELMLQSQITCHTFLCLFQPRPLWNWLTETRDMSKELGLFYVIFLTVTLYIKWDQFIIVQVTLPTSSHQVPSNFMLVKKSYIWNPWVLWLCWPSRSFLEITLTDSNKSRPSSDIKFPNTNIKETGILLLQLYVTY